MLAGFSDPTVVDVVRRTIAGAAYRDTVDRLLAALDHLPPELRARRVEQALGVAFLTLAAAEAGTRRGPAPEAAIIDLVNVCTAIVEAPGPSQPSAK